PPRSFRGLQLNVASLLGYHSPPGVFQKRDDCARVHALCCKTHARRSQAKSVSRDTLLERRRDLGKPGAFLLGPHPKQAHARTAPDEAVDHECRSAAAAPL